MLGVLEDLGTEFADVIWAVGARTKSGEARSGEVIVGSSCRGWDRGLARGERREARDEILRCSLVAGRYLVGAR